MLILGILGFQTILLLLFPVVLSLWVHKKWRNMVARKEEIKRLVDSVSKESSTVEFEATHEYYALPRGHRCAMCFRLTTTRCSQCKSVHYCSGKCQIIHWRQGHKDKCQSLTASVHTEQGRELNEKSTSGKQFEKSTPGKQFETCGVESESLVHAPPREKLCSSGNGILERSSETIALDVLSTRTGSKEAQEVEIPAPMSTRLADGVSHASKLIKMKINNIGEGFDRKPQLPKAKMAIYDDNKAAKVGYKKSNRRAASSEMLVTEASTPRSSLLSSCSRLDSVANNEEDDSRPSKNKEGKSLVFNDSGGHQVDACRKSVWRKGSKQSHSYKIIFTFELFAKLYSCDEELYPFGLINCGNSCYANAVLQCLAFTRPLTSYLLRGLHSNTCRETEWCFICELEFLIIKAKGGNSPFSPIRILSNIQKIGSHFGHGREEDAHEFLRYAVDTMQSVCLNEAEARGPFAEETTLVALMFGGYLQSKITCMKCFAKSERFERIMDLTVEIDGDIGTLEEALMQFTADEVLDGENRYNCSRCKSHVKAKKKLKIAEAPNIITIVLKRFQSDNFGKLNKSVQFPEVLDMAPYMCGKSDKSPHYSLYAVIVHRDYMNATSSGHYVCYVKNFHGKWFGVNDCNVISVESGRVLSEGAYMLLYARYSPRAPSVLRNGTVSHGVKSKKRNLEAVPATNSSSKTSSMSSRVLSGYPSKVQQRQGKDPYRMTMDDTTGNELCDSKDWRSHQIGRVAQMDSSSESSSLWSCSDASSSSTVSTKESERSGDLSDFLFGEVGLGGHSRYGHSSGSDASSFYRDPETDLRWRGWSREHLGNDWR